MLFQRAKLDVVGGDGHWELVAEGSVGHSQRDWSDFWIAEHGGLEDAVFVGARALQKECHLTGLGVPLGLTDECERELMDRLILPYENLEPQPAQGESRPDLPRHQARQGQFHLWISARGRRG